MYRYVHSYAQVCGALLRNFHKHFLFFFLLRPETSSVFSLSGLKLNTALVWLETEKT